jgi:hypothetical protein
MDFCRETYLAMINFARCQFFVKIMADGQLIAGILKSQFQCTKPGTVDLYQV